MVGWNTYKIVMEKVSLKYGTVISLAVLLSSIVGSHFKAIADGKEYTDQQVQQVEKDIKDEQKDIKKNVDDMKVDLAVIKQILIKKYGAPAPKNGD